MFLFCAFWTWKKWKINCPKDRQRLRLYEPSIRSYTKWKKVCASLNYFSSSSGKLKCKKRYKKQNYTSVVLTSIFYPNEIKKDAAERKKLKLKKSRSQAWKKLHLDLKDTLCFSSSYSMTKKNFTCLCYNELFSSSKSKESVSGCWVQVLEALWLYWSCKQSQNVNLWHTQMKNKSNWRLMPTESRYITTLCSEYQHKIKLSFSTNEMLNIVLDGFFSSAFNVCVSFYPE
jgi:hypothetical protein